MSTDLTRTSPAVVGVAAPSHSRTGGRFVAGTVLAGIALGAAAGLVGLVTSWSGSRTMVAESDVITRAVALAVLRAHR